MDRKFTSISGNEFQVSGTSFSDSDRYIHQGVEALRKISKFHLISWCGNCTLPHNFHTGKLGKISVFYAVRGNYNGISTGGIWSHEENSFHINILELQAAKLATFTFTKEKQSLIIYP